MRYDMVILGGGSAGLVCTLGAASMGARVALIEKHKLGGECLNTGCVPSKAFIKAAKVAHQIGQADRFGLSGSVPRVDFARVIAYVQQTIATIGVHDRPSNFEAAGAEVLFGSPRFVSPTALHVDGRRIEFKSCVVATGSHPFVPDVSGLQEAGYLTNENVFTSTRLPARLAVLGGGPIGCELAQSFARFGSKVTVLVSGEWLLPKEDEDVSAAVAAFFADEGIDVLTRAKLSSVAVQHGDKICTVQLDGRELFLPCDEILVATGRRANVQGLDLEAAGVTLDDRGYVRVDDGLRTTSPRIWACGDVHGRYQFTHTAEYEAKFVLAQALFRLPLKPSYRVIPWATFTDPEVAHVGLTEREAKAQGLSYEAWRFDTREVDRAITDDATSGFYKLVTDRKGRILGASIVAANAGELIHEAILAMQHKITARALSEAIHVYPTLALGLRRAADNYSLKHLAPAWVLRTVQRLFGYKTDGAHSSLLTGKQGNP